MGGLALVPRELPAVPNPVEVYLDTLADGSERTMRDALDAIARIHSRGQYDRMGIDWAALRYEDTQEIRRLLLAKRPKRAKRLSPASVNKSLSALRGVLRECWRLKLMSSEEYRRAIDIPAVKGSRLPKGRVLASAEIKALYLACARDPIRVAGARDAAAIALLHSYGLRRSEVIGLDLADYRDGMIVVRGKGDKERHAFGFNGASKAIRAWLRRRGSDPGPLLYPVTKLGEIVPRRLGAQSLYDKLRLRGEQAGIPRFSPHDFRKTFISSLLAKGIDLATVSRMAGHANVQTTAGYDLRPEEVQREAAASIDTPYAEGS